MMTHDHWLLWGAAGAAAVTSAALAALVVARRPRRALQCAFSLGMTGFAAESVVFLLLFTRARPAVEPLTLLTLGQVVALIVPLAWARFVVALDGAPGAAVTVGPRITLGVAAAGALASVAAVLAFPAFRVPAGSETFDAAGLTPGGALATVYQLLITVGVLAGLEASLRASRGESRWRIKYVVLALGGVFLVRFYVLSSALLVGSVTASALATQSASLFLAGLVIAGSLLRERVQEANLTISRALLYRSVVVAVLGLYLLMAGVMAWLVNWLDVPEALFWSSVAIFVSALGLAAVLLSEDVRWRIRRFIGMNFYRSKYDYREQWTRFTKRLGSIVTLEDLAPQLLGFVTEAVGAPRAVLYAAGDAAGSHRLAAAVEVGQAPARLTITADLRARLLADRAPVPLGDTGGGDGARASGAVLAALGDHDLVLLVPLVWRNELVGLMAVGRERTGLSYTVEDVELLTTFGEQAAGAIVTARLSERLARTREFETFHRLTSFVIHDLKNAISALSMLTQNALDHMGDPEFQRDAIHTVSRTAGRMRALLAKLTTDSQEQRLRFDAVDLPALVDDALPPLFAGKRIRLRKELRAVPVITGDAEALQEVIQNLALNAIDAVNGDGDVAVETYCEGDAVVFAIADRGCGIPKEFLRNSLFAPFRSTKKGGWGVGLYHAKEIVESHGGTIEVASREGEGTTFRVRLPVHGVGGPDMAPHTPPTLGSAPGNPGRSSMVACAGGGPDMAPHAPPRSEAPRGTRGAPRLAAPVLPAHPTGVRSEKGGRS
ncbi:MAG: PEP-CTERM system histidine kinase PrsK [Candidatus Rokubacteria bacterium]|nr:PEP-CTERM system histidine kinase PrsK [Candidatus Rokubacteria bacterium]